jgi:hypothetical protein
MTGNGSVSGPIKAVGFLSSMEVWWVGTDYSVQWASWSESQSWQRYELAPPLSVNSPSIAAVSRIPNSMEVWWTGRGDRSVQGAYWYEGQSWQRYELAPPESAHALGRITAVSRIPNSMEVWWVGPGYSIQGAYWYEGQPWQRYELAPPGSAYAEDITAVSRIPTSMEVWWFGPDHSVQGAYWYEGQPWQRYQLAPPGSACSTGITAISRIPNSMEVWWLGASNGIPNGSVQGAYWYEGQPWQRYELAPPNSAHPSSSIAAVSRIPTSMEVWWQGPLPRLGSVQGAYWYEGQQWQRYELAPPTGDYSFDITAVSRIPNSMEVWWTGPNNSVQGAYWYEGQQWQRYKLAPPGSASFAITALSRSKFVVI